MELLLLLFSLILKLVSQK